MLHAVQLQHAHKSLAAGDLSHIGYLADLFGAKPIFVFLGGRVHV
jgi:hypothetical protein